MGCREEEGNAGGPERLKPVLCADAGGGSTGTLLQGKDSRGCSGTRGAALPWALPPVFTQDALPRLQQRVLELC